MLETILKKINEDKGRELIRKRILRLNDLKALVSELHNSVGSLMSIISTRFAQLV